MDCNDTNYPNVQLLQLTKTDSQQVVKTDIDTVHTVHIKVVKDKKTAPNRQPVFWKTDQFITWSKFTTKHQNVF